MALKITDDCIACELCVAECPNEAISAADPICIIDPNLCTECVGFFDQPQCVEVCPANAIVPDPDHLETKEDLMEKRRHVHY